MVDNVEVIDDFIAQEDFDKIQQLLMGKNFPWYSNTGAAPALWQDTRHQTIMVGKPGGLPDRPDLTHGEPDTYNFQFIHSFYVPWMDVGYQSVYSDYFPILFPILRKLPIRALWRIKANMVPRQDKYIIHGHHLDITHYDEFQEAKGHLLGVDISPEEYKFASKTAVFYVNNNNGHTIFADGTKVDSVANRITIFDAQELHSGTSCTDMKCRVSINFNYF